MGKRALIETDLNGMLLGEAVARDMGVSIEDGEAAMHAVLGVIARALAAGRSVSVTNFGRFEPVEVPERGARNPQTGERMVCPSTRRVRFVPSRRLREVVRSGDQWNASIRKLPKGTFTS